MKSLADDYDHIDDIYGVDNDFADFDAYVDIVITVTLIIKGVVSPNNNLDWVSRKQY